MVESRYAFLESLHTALKPRGYLEIGVQSGGSLSLAKCPSIGIDPRPLIGGTGDMRIFALTSDQFFETEALNQRLGSLPSLDLVFIDGMHLWEYALRDFVNVERHSHPGTVVVFDDVLPYSQWIATRTQPPGDWTGDVWKVDEVLWQHRPHLKRVLVDTFPTGALVVWDLDHFDNELPEHWYEIMANPEWGPETPVPDSVLQRTRAVPAEAALEMIMEGRT